jgi:ADP-ribosylglycohydrolase
MNIVNLTPGCQVKAPGVVYGGSRMISLKDRFLGCMLGGAVGDALGAPVEFLARREIVDRFGPDGIVDFAESYGRVGAITDDTQMAMFTAEGMGPAVRRAMAKGIWGTEPSFVYHSYRYWLKTQGERLPPVPKMHGLANPVAGEYRSWLLELPEMHSRRAPGRTCIAALKSGDYGTVAHPINQSKGCGGVMRIAPVGLFGRFEAGCEIAAITHGHPSGYLAAGFLTVTLGALREGRGLHDAIELGRASLRAGDHHHEVLAAVEQACSEARQGASPEAVERLGEGWVAEEALAIALYCALAADGFETGVRLAVNHGGDSDSTGAIAGNLLGTMYGVTAIPERWLAQLELRPEIEKLALDLLDSSQGEER